MMLHVTTMAHGRRATQSRISREHDALLRAMAKRAKCDAIATEIEERSKAATPAGKRAQKNAERASHAAWMLALKIIQMPARTMDDALLKIGAVSVLVELRDQGDYDKVYSASPNFDNWQAPDKPRDMLSAIEVAPLLLITSLRDDLKRFNTGAR